MLRVLSAPPLCTVQDLGRSGRARFGVPRSGAVDWFALAAANRLVRNPAGAAGLEFALGGFQAQVVDDCLVAGAGCGYELLIGGRAVGLWRAALARCGETVAFVPQETAGWGYLAVSGGVQVPPVMGSRATYLRGGFGGLDGRAVQAGDCLALGGGLPPDWPRRAGRVLSPALRPPYGLVVILPAVPGPQEAAFSEAGRERFWSSEYTVTPASDRMGYRLAGPNIDHLGSADLLSEGMLPGSVQVPADGQPIVMLCDGPTAGGYPKIATVTTLGLPLLAQALPGLGRVRFQKHTVGEAQAAYRRAWEILEKVGKDMDGSEL